MRQTLRGEASFTFLGELTEVVDLQVVISKFSSFLSLVFI